MNLTPLEWEAMNPSAQTAVEMVPRSPLAPRAWKPFPTLAVPHLNKY